MQFVSHDWKFTLRVICSVCSVILIVLSRLCSFFFPFPLPRHLCDGIVASFMITPISFHIQNKSESLLNEVWIKAHSFSGLVNFRPHGHLLAKIIPGGYFIC